MKTITDLRTNVNKLIDEFENQNQPVLKNIMERIKTFNDVLQYHEFKMTDEKTFTMFQMIAGNSSDEIAYQKLKLIISALNEGWQPDWNNSNEYKYYPYFDMRSGVGFSDADCDYWITIAGVGSRLCFKSAELAKYAGETFIDIYKEFLTIK